MSAKNWLRLCILVAGFAAANAGNAQPPDPKRNLSVDLVRIATRYIEGYSSAVHQIPDSDGEFVENTIIPSVVGVAENAGDQMNSGLRIEIMRFLLASRGMASEPLADLGADLFESNPTAFCGDLSKLQAHEKSSLLSFVQSATQMRHQDATIRVNCELGLKK